MENNNITLLIMAAGMGSRFGGLKQIEPVGPSGEFMIDYSIYDAIEAGFTKIVFIIKEENYELFEETVGKRVKQHIKVEYAFQKNDDLPEGYTLPVGRVKPWGTAHAIASAKNLIKENFAIINADDFYGRDAFNVVSNFLKNTKASDKSEYAVVGYRVKNTMSENGSVKRGVLEAIDGYLTKLTESVVENQSGKIIATPLSGKEPFEIMETTPVSMNMFGFTPEIFEYIDSHFKEFLDQNKENLEKCEYLIPDVVENTIKEGLARVTLLDTTAVWQGITYREDKDQVVKEIANMAEKGVYPHDLWK